ncbi:MAG: hypothetical protein QOK11_3098, partial [Pseudonocardiales bacterium]|nr:hypothetical protein [Pseudonocardiales bacterium]
MPLPPDVVGDGDWVGVEVALGVGVAVGVAGAVVDGTGLELAGARDVGTAGEVADPVGDGEWLRGALRTGARLPTGAELELAVCWARCGELGCAEAVLWTPAGSPVCGCDAGRATTYAAAPTRASSATSAASRPPRRRCGSRSSAVLGRS